MPTLAVLDASPTFRRSLARALAEAHGFAPAGEGGTAEEALSLVASKEPDLALVGRVPGLDGPALCAELGALRPRPPTRLVVLSPVLDPPFVARALVAGAAGFLGREADPEEIARTLRRTLSGGDERRTAHDRTRAGRVRRGRSRLVTAGTAAPGRTAA